MMQRHNASFAIDTSRRSARGGTRVAVSITIKTTKTTAATTV
ncbi:hypothetical protein [Breoghania sp.]|nr:hypothetical protein [Breoghania sp.]MDJ0930441.1 hypothetical protein [Breoghania sp.]